MKSSTSDASVQLCSARCPKCQRRCFLLPRHLFKHRCLRHGKF